ncbi:hypothetical protein [Clostridium botulinum]|uniref:Head decoration protein n=1 Tax=Clostridium botulinum TaxID=1491 RepID=A0A6G4EDE3_CLOBO|nr:hypothetical protein [Clostridium botulinum]AUM91514.1 hypothetical protein RSJ5_09585 [Clostridium botulinum]NFB12912.1 hypothetical protein [Clostridium botulinum]NFH57842.1 hypothetical protein [Clostridium botulinum]NFH61195.1 hypothetical protein [Clostridium botulinum]NFJ87285.1 hypothetical protein [Clostridium botulinum]
MYFKKITYENDMEILVTPANLVTFTGTVLAANVASADANGKKYIKSGTLIDSNGNIVKQTGGEGSETLTSVPVGVLYCTVDVDNGDMPCSLVVEGHLRADRVLDGFAESAITEIKTALPKITFR